MKALSLLVALLVAAGCGSTPDQPKPPGASPASPSPEAQASPQINQSFTKTDTQAAPAATSDHSHVIIKKAALEKEYLMMTSLIKLVPAPQFEARESLIVSFVKREGKIVMLNSTHVQELGNNHSELILAQFPILNENSDQFEIDFNGGMKQLFIMSSQVDPTDKNEPVTQVVAPINMSYLKEVTFADESMFIRQIAQFKNNQTIMDAEVRYLIKPYSPDPSFVPLEYRDQENGIVGYFTNDNNPIAQDGEQLKYANKWNSTKPITFYISANTPADMRDSIRAGLLYWNRILGADKVKVIQLEDASIVAPRFDMNIVQWVDWDHLGTAYADWHSDPRTGEILSANIFYPSGKPPVQNTRDELFNLGITGFNQPSSVADPVQPGSGDQSQFQNLTKKMVLNNVFVTIAHEFGHVLGLKHNFAGSLAASYDFKDRSTVLQNYLRTQTIPDDLKVSSSVMEYLKVGDKSMLAEIINRSQNTSVLPYDAMAMSHLYLNQPLPTENRPVFCTNGDETTYADCIQFDAGKSVVSYSSGLFQTELENIARIIYEEYFPVNPTHADAVNFHEVSISSAGITAMVATPLKKFVSLLKAPDFIAVKSKHMPLLRQQRSSIALEEQVYLKSEIDRLGGLDNIMKPLDDDNFPKDIVTKFTQLLDSANPNLPAADRTYLIDQVKLVSRQIKSRIIMAELEILSGKTEDAPIPPAAWTESDLTNQLAQINEKWFQRYVLSQTPAPAAVELSLLDGSKAAVQLPSYTYNETIRAEAAKLFDGHAESINWAYAEKQRAISAMQAELAHMGDLTKLDQSKFQPETSLWLLTNQSIMRTLRATIPGAETSR